MAIPALIAFIGILAVLAIFGVRKYIAAAKQVEARNSMGTIGMRAAAAYERDRKLCASASAPVPEGVPHGMKFQSAATDWTRDEGLKAGFSCLQFEMSMPQYYQYNYQSTGSSFIASARGDLNADNNVSLFQLRGDVVGDAVQVASSIEETSPEE